MKKTNNKGFSLVELIIVIAIMAILAGAIAPALIRYIDKARKSDDVSSAKTIKTAVETAMSNEDTYELLTTGSTGSKSFVDGGSVVASATIEIEPGKDLTASGSGSVANITITATGNKCDTTKVATITSDAQKEIGANIGEKSPKLKYKKAAGKNDGHSSTPDKYTVFVTEGGSVTACVQAGTDFYQLAPEVSKYYQ